MPGNKFSVPLNMIKDDDECPTGSSRIFLNLSVFYGEIKCYLLDCSLRCKNFSRVQILWVCVIGNIFGMKRDRRGTKNI
jgi:hypothetical protein